MRESVHTPPGGPLVGSLPRLVDDPLRFLTGVQEAYGGQYPLLRLDQRVGDPVTVVLDAGLVHEVLADRERFRRPDALPQEQRRQGLLSSDGILWEQQRSVLQPEFVGANVARFADVASDTVAETLAAWPDDGTVDVFAETSVLTMRVITRALFSRDTDPGRAREVHDALSAQVGEFQPSVADVLLPEWLRGGVSAEFREADERLAAIAEEFVEWHRRQEDPPDDMVTALIEAQADPEITLSENELVDEAVLFMTGGQETTALTITYALYWLSQHPEAYDRVAREAADVLDGRAPEWGDLSALSYTERVVRETLRLTPAVWNVTRETREPTEVAGAHLDAGETLLLSTYAHHRDPRVWDRPREFRPDRWAGEVSRGVDAYFPFGSGPRVCIGRQVALTEAQFTLAHLLQEYDVEVSTDDLSLTPGITLRPSEPIRARVRKRE